MQRGAWLNHLVTHCHSAAHSNIETPIPIFLYPFTTWATLWLISHFLANAADCVGGSICRAPWADIRTDTDGTVPSFIARHALLPICACWRLALCSPLIPPMMWTIELPYHNITFTSHAFAAWEDNTNWLTTCPLVWAGISTHLKNTLRYLLPPVDAGENGDWLTPSEHTWLHYIHVDDRRFMKTFNCTQCWSWQWRSTNATLTFCIKSNFAPLKCIIYIKIIRFYFSAGNKMLLLFYYF